MVLLNQAATKCAEGLYQLTLALGNNSHVWSPCLCICWFALLFPWRVNCPDFLSDWSCRAGDSWSHASTNRIILFWKGEERCAYIDKSASLPSASAPYSITSEGIRNSITNCKRIRMMWSLWNYLYSVDLNRLAERRNRCGLSLVCVLCIACIFIGVPLFSCSCLLN